MDINREILIQAFLGDSSEHLSAIEEALLSLENNPQDQELLYTIFRSAHSLKGDSSLLGFENLTYFAHTLESLLERLRNNTITINNSIITLMLKSVDCIREMISAAINGNEQLQPYQEDLLAELSKITANNTNEDESKTNVIKEIEEIGEIETESLLDELDPELDEKPTIDLFRTEHTKSENEPSQTIAKSIRININKLDRMLTLTEEIAIARGQFKQMLSENQNYSRLLESFQEADRLHLELQELIMKARMIPLAPLFRQYTRIVRDLALANGKAVQLNLKGTEVEADTSIVEHLKAPLSHLLRNAVDHGIETAEIRQSLGKDVCGQITLSAEYNSGYIVIELSDDGAGINRSRILEKARAQGLISETDKLSESEIDKLIFRPGFSTAENITELSGRGIGLDVVKQNIEALRGTINIISKANEGTTFSIRLPLTLAIIEGFIIGVGSETYIIPLELVTECLELPQDSSNLNCGVINLRGEALPFVRLHNLFSLNGHCVKKESVVIIQYGKSRAGVVVDKLYGQNQVVIKPLGKLFQNLSYISGSAIMGSGRVALILDIPAIMKQLETQALA